MMLDDYITTPQLERVRFYSRKQKEHESIVEYLSELKKLATPCEFGSFWNEAIRDCFIMGMGNNDTKNILLYTRNLTLENAENIALAKEIVVEQNSIIKTETLAIEDGSSTSSPPRSSQDVYNVNRDLSFRNTQANIFTTTSNPGPLSYPAFGIQPNQGPINNENNGQSSSSSRETHIVGHTGSSQDVYNVKRDLSFLNAQANLFTTTLNPGPLSYPAFGIQPNQGPINNENNGQSSSSSRETHIVGHTGSSQDVYNVKRDLSFLNAQANLFTTTLNPGPLSYPAFGIQPNQGPINNENNGQSSSSSRETHIVGHTDDNSPAQLPTSHHTSIPLATQNGSQPVSFTTQDTPSTSNDDGQKYKKNKQCQEYKQSLVPVVSEDGTKVFKCGFCSSEFSHESLVINHLVKHTGEKKFSCEFCFRKFPYQGTVSAHKKKHCKKNPDSLKNKNKRKRKERSQSR